MNQDNILEINDCGHVIKERASLATRRFPAYAAALTDPGFVRLEFKWPLAHLVIRKVADWNNIDAVKGLE